MKIFAFIQIDDGVVNRLSVETLTGAQKLAAATNGSVTAVVFGAVPDDLKTYKVKEILNVQAAELEDYSPLYYIEALSRIISSESPDTVVFGHTYQVRDWVPRLSARLKLPFLVDCIGFKTDDNFTVTRQISQGKINADMAFENPSLISFQSGAFRADEVESGTAEVRAIALDLSAVPGTIRPGEKYQQARGSVDLSHAKVIVSVGRGIGKEENIPLVKELADALSAELGCSRPVVDYGWLPHERQVGSSGQTVSPKLYLALGISGAIQHQVGMKGADTIVAINKDENAPIFEIADIGIVADLFEIVPKLTESIKAKK
ncbi:MAG: electron transfer flavoprotein subunit alpha/FixB family protein [FCB group bacterium]|nr:electron transfer flavoprotein subunit alpha/FixB family protein [FCB group bacterium]